MIARLMTVTAAVLAGAAAAAQAPATGDIDRPNIGSAMIGGQVVTDGPDALPVRRAVVSLTGEDLRPNRGAITDDDGRFRIAGLPAGRYSLTASRAAFITSAYGARRPGEPGTTIALADGEALTGLSMRLWRGAAVAGIVRDQDGAPAEGVAVSAVPASPPRDRTLLTLSNNGVVTNELGEFRLFGLLPGAYLISATPSTRGNSATIALADEDVDAALAALANRTSAGATVPLPARTTQTPPQPFHHATIYFPGTPSRVQAVPIAVEAGGERLGVDFALLRVGTVTVEGTVSRPDGQPAAGAAVQLVEAIASEAFAAVQPALLDAVAGPDGRFRFTRVTTGSYEVTARADAAGRPSSGASTLPIGGRDPGAALWSSTHVSVGTHDLSSLALTVQPGQTMTGRVRFEGTQPTPSGTTWMALVPPAVRALPPGTPIRTLRSVISATARDDGSFELRGIGPGAYLLMASAPDPDRWWLQSAVLDGRDLLDGPIEGDSLTKADGVVVTFSDRRTALTGRLQTPAGLPATDYSVIVFSADRAHWFPGARRTRAMRPASDGMFSVDQLPAGRYLVAAVTDIIDGEWQRASFLEQLAAFAVPVDVRAGETVRQDLQIAAGR